MGGEFDFWTEVRVGHWVDVRTSPDTKQWLETFLQQQGLSWTIMVEDIGVLMEEELVPAAPRNLSAGHNMDWTSYHPIEDIYSWFTYLESTCDFCETENIGQSYEGQEMIVMKVCKGGCGNKPAMWIDSGIHAREWVSPATGTFMLNELVTNDADHPSLTEKLDWYFLPVHNPDGYRKTQNDNRMWRKTTTHYSGDAARAPTLTVTGTTTGPTLAPPATAAPRLTTAPRPSPRWSAGTPGTSSLLIRTRSSSTRPWTVMIEDIGVLMEEELIPAAPR